MIKSREDKISLKSLLIPVKLYSSRLNLAFSQWNIGLLFCKGYEKSVKKLTLIFFLNPVAFNGQSYKKQKALELETSHSSGYEISSQKFLY